MHYHVTFLWKDQNKCLHLVWGCQCIYSFDYWILNCSVLDLVLVSVLINGYWCWSTESQCLVITSPFDILPHPALQIATLTSPWFHLPVFLTASNVVTWHQRWLLGPSELEGLLGPSPFFCELTFVVLVENTLQSDLVCVESLHWRSQFWAHLVVGSTDSILDTCWRWLLSPSALDDLLGRQCFGANLCGARRKHIARWYTVRRIFMTGDPMLNIINTL